MCFTATAFNFVSSVLSLTWCDLREGKGTMGADQFEYDGYDGGRTPPGMRRVMGCGLAAERTCWNESWVVVEATHPGKGNDPFQGNES